jgi:hypothetical protein
MNARYRDFDQAWSETAGEPIKFMAMGEEFSLPPEIPARVILKILRLSADKVEDVSDDQAIDLALSILGKKQVDRLLELGISMDKLEQIVDWAMSEYGMGSDPNPPTPAVKPGKRKQKG